MIGSDSPFRQRMRAEMDAQLTKEYERRDKEKIATLGARCASLEGQIREIHAAWSVYRGSRNIMDMHILTDRIHAAFEDAR